MNERLIKHRSGMAVLILDILAILVLGGGVVWGAVLSSGGRSGLGVSLIIVSCLLISACSMLFAGLKILHPNEAYVFTLFGKYYGTLKGAGFFFVNPFVSAINPAAGDKQEASEKAGVSGGISLLKISGSDIGLPVNKRMSLKAMTLDNNHQKINDALGNPIIIGIVVIWRINNTAMAAFNVDNYKEFLSIQCDSALRNIVRVYPYDLPGHEEGERSLRGSSQEVGEKIRTELQEKTAIAGLEIIEARITQLSYAPEIAAAMLQRQQASAVVDARQMIVEGAVGMVEMALAKLNERDIIKLDEERKAAMVSNLLVVLCGSKDAQPIVNSGSLY
ncbi:membrane protein [Clostridia bacterium]|nr:membrane protein [Clostridia bacterium]